MNFCRIAQATVTALAVGSVLALGASAETNPPGGAAQPKAPAKAAIQAKKPAGATLAASPKKAAVAAHPKKAVPMPRPRPVQLAALSRSPMKPIASATPIVPAGMTPMSLAPTSLIPAAPIPGALIANAPIPTAAAPAPVPRMAAPPDATAVTTASAEDLAAVKKAADLVRHGKTDEATQVERSIADPLARKLVEWLVLRTEDTPLGFNRYAAFIAANPGWPSLALLRKRAEGALWEEQRDPGTVRAFFATVRPASAKGRLALARALLATGERADAEHLVRETWQRDAMSREVEAMAMSAFGGLLTRADDKARMDRRLYADDTGAGLRAALRLGGGDLAIAQARVAVIAKSGSAKALLEAVPAEVRNDPLYIFTRIQWLRRNDNIAEAAQLMLAAPRDPAAIHDVDEWWAERRLIARKILDADAAAAYRIARDSAPPVKDHYRADQQFTAGWVALRFLGDPGAALTHFSRIAHGVANPITLARAGYWQGRALEALGRRDEARTHYEAAARFATAYYGQLARARLGLGEIVLNPPPQPSKDKRATLLAAEVVRAAQILYAIDAADFVVPMVQDLAEKAQDVGALIVLAELAQRHADARAMLLIGKTVLARGFSFDHFAFPDVGVPKYAALRQVDRSIVYAIVRQESAFQAKVASSANALGLMQIMPGTGRALAKKFGLQFDQRRLAQDPAYNAQLGSAELSDLLQDFRGSYILTFAAYNAGRARVRQWLSQYGDPRDPKVDPIDWVERIPFSETRNYVQRVMENMQVYRVRFGSSKLMIEADIRRGAVEN